MCRIKFYACLRLLTFLSYSVMRVTKYYQCGRFWQCNYSVLDCTHVIGADSFPFILLCLCEHLQIWRFFVSEVAVFFMFHEMTAYYV